MHDLIVPEALPAMSPEAISKVRALGELSLLKPQVPIECSHLLHAGMYARSIIIPADVILTGVLIKIATILIVNGTTDVYIGEDKPLRLEGYNVLPASAGRRQAFRTYTRVDMTMLFPTTAQTVEEAEREFTDESARLSSHYNVNHRTITGE